MLDRHSGMSRSYGEVSDWCRVSLQNICNYRIELGLEEIRRKTDMDVEPASVRTIFTARNVTFKRPAD